MSIYPLIFVAWRNPMVCSGGEGPRGGGGVAQDAGHGSGGVSSGSRLDRNVLCLRYSSYVEAGFVVHAPWATPSPLGHAPTSPRSFPTTTDHRIPPSNKDSWINGHIIVITLLEADLFFAAWPLNTGWYLIIHLEYFLRLWWIQTQLAQTQGRACSRERCSLPEYCSDR